MTTRIKLINVGLSYPTLSERARLASKPDEQGKRKFQATFVLPKGSDNAKRIQDAVIAALVAKFGPTGPDRLTPNGAYANPLHVGPASLRAPDGTQKYPAELWEGWAAARTGEEYKPQIVHPYAGPDGKPALLTEAEIENPRIIYPGLIVNATVTAFVYENKKRGVGLALNNIQRVRDSERFDTRVNAQDEFSAVEGADASDMLDLLN